MAETEAYRLAQAALSEAREARYKADSAAQSQSSHEEVCSERYQRINKQLEILALLPSSISDIRVKQAESLALNKAIAVVSTVVGCLYVVLKVTGHG